MMNKTGFALAFALSLASINAYSVLPAQVNGEPLPSLSPMLDRSMPAVVNISTAINVKNHYGQ